MDINSFFMPDVYSESDKFYLRRSDVWPIVVAINSASGGKVLCSFNDVSTTSYKFTTKEGMNVLRLEVGKNKKGDRLFTLKCYDYPLRDAATELIKSTKPKYIASKLVKKDYAIYNTVQRCVMKAETQMNYEIHHMIEKSINNQFKSVSNKPWAAVSHHMGTYLLRMYMNEIPKHSFPSDIVSELDSSYQKYSESMNVYRNECQQFKEFWSTDKWIIVGSKEFGYMIGKISKDRMAEAAEYFCSENNNNFYANGYLNHMIVPFKWYKTLENITDDDPIKEPLSCALLLAKVHRNDNELMPSNPWVRHIYPEIGAMADCSPEEPVIFILEG